VRIDGIIGPEYFNMPNDKSGPGKSKEASTSKAGESDMELVQAHKSLIRAAMVAEDVDKNAVNEARQALQSGQLDTPEAARRAAIAMLARGF
jgi:hypothetical protein